MGNAIKNYEKKRRREQKENYRKMQRMVHNAVMKNFPLPREIKEKEAEIFDVLNEIW